MTTSGNIKDEEHGHPFPEDLTMDILQRLPVVSLLRFECVSKNWYSLIKNPFFARLHINYNKKDKRRPKILIYDGSSNLNYMNDPLDNSIPPITFISFPNDNYNAKRILEIPDYLQKCSRLSNVIGSVDGLFLLQKGNFYRNEDVRLALWNPATREVAPLPQFQFQDQPPHSFKNMQFGFGLDPVTNDYKVVWFCTFWDQNECRWDPRLYAAVYSCCSDSWRVLEHHKMINSVPDFIRAYAGTYQNGAYYWYGKGDKNIVFSFNFSSEVFMEIPGPDIPNSIVCSLMLLDDSLTICTIDGEMLYYDLWIMIQPGVWNKVFTFQGLSALKYQYCGYWDSSTVIFQTKKGWLVSYDVRTEEMRHLGYGQRYNMFLVIVMYYKDSLVTIRRGNKEMNHCSLPDFFDSSLHLPSEFCDPDDLLDASWLYH